MSDTVIRIGKLENGFEVEVYEPPKPVKSSKNQPSEYRDPWKCYAFSTPDEVIAFLTKQLPDVNSPADEFSAGFTEASTLE